MGRARKNKTQSQVGGSEKQIKTYIASPEKFSSWPE